MIIPGSSLGRFKLLEVLGRGGMGEVWRAEDPRLGREVALKVIPSLFSRDEERVARLRREARALAALNHPHVAQVYELEEVRLGQPGVDEEQVHFLVMELVEGQSLARVLERNPLPADEVRRLGGQLVSALRAVHDRGVVHRDLKPANVVLTPGGDAKLIDFGLARFQRQKAPAPGESDITAALSYPGMAVGTAAYMSPEQVRGRGCQEPGDVWAFGCCLGEMLTGVPLFSRQTIPDTLAAILAGEPDLSGLPAATPRWLGDLVRACLAHDPASRPTLEEVAAALAAEVTQPDTRRWRPGRRLVAGLAVAGGTLALAWLLGTGIQSGVSRDSAGEPFLAAIAPVTRPADGLITQRLAERVTAEVLRVVTERPDLAVRLGNGGSVRVAGLLMSRGGEPWVYFTVTDGTDGTVLAQTSGPVAADGSLGGPGGPGETLADILEFEQVVRLLRAQDPLHGYLGRRTRSLAAARAFAEGVNHFTRTRWDPARQAMERALADDPGFWPAHLYLGLVASSQGRFAEKRLHLAAVRALLPQPADAERALVEATAALLEEDNQRALEALEQSRRVFPESGELLYRTAQAYRRQDRPEDAIPLLRKLLAREWQPDWSPTREELVHSLLLAGRTSRAISVAREGEERFPQRFRYPLYQAYGHRLRRQDPAAREALARAIRKRLDFSRSDLLVTRSLTQYWAAMIGWEEERLRQWSALQEVAEERLRNESGDEAARMALGEALHGQGRHEEARRVLESLAAGCDDAYASLALARVLAALGQGEAARQQMGCAAEVWRQGDIAALGTLAYNIGCAWVLLDDHVQAMDWLRRARDLYGMDRLDAVLDPDLEPLRRSGLLAAGPGRR